MSISNRMGDLSDEQRAVLELLLSQKRSAAPAKSSIPTIPREDGQTFPLSFAQQRLWFLDQLEPGSSAYIIPGAVRVRGLMNVEALRQALGEMNRRHESLRTSFPLIDGQPVQKIHPPSMPALNEVDLTHLPETEREDQARGIALSEVQKPFDLAAGPLMRVALLKLGEQDHVLVSAMHHIISDGWSMGIFNREIARVYQSLCDGLVMPVEQPPIQYADYSVWQREWLSGDTLTRQLDYWRQKLAGAPQTTEIPSDYVRQHGANFTGGKTTGKIPLAAVESLHALAKRENASLFMVLLAAFKALLSRFSGQKDLVIGTPIAGRNRSEVEEVIGFFVNTLVMRTVMEPRQTFRSLLQSVRETSLEAYSNQEMPFERLVEELHPERNINRTPLFQVFFNLLNFQENQIDLKSMKVEPFDVFESQPKFDLTLYVAERKGVPLDVTLHYNADLFTSARMEELLRQYAWLIEQMVAEPDKPIEEYSLITPSARAVLPEADKPLESIPAPSILGRLKRVADDYPNRDCLVEVTLKWTWRQLERTSNQLAHHLIEHGVSKGDVVAIYGARSASLVCAMVGIWKARAAFAVLDPAYPVERLLSCIEASRPVAIIELEAAGLMPEALDRQIAMMELRARVKLPENHVQSTLFPGLPQSAPDKLPSAEDIACVAFTSGTTGKPKAIASRHEPLWHFLRWHVENFGLKETDNFSMLGGLAHDPLLRDIFTPLWLGATLHIPPQKIMTTPEFMNAWAKQQRITVMHLTPALGTFLSDFQPALYQRVSEQDALASVRYAFFGGDSLTPQVLRQFTRSAASATCVNFYGATETPQAMAWRKMELDEFKDGPRRRASMPIGAGIDGVQLLVLNSNNNQCGIGELGEICVRTSHLSEGYINDPDLTAQRFVANPCTGHANDLIYRTGDLGRYLPDGQVEHCGRADSQVKVRGFRVELDEVESVLNSHPAIDQAVVMAQADQAGSNRLVAYLSSHQQPSPTISDLRTFVQQRLPEYMSPSVFFLLPEMPLTPNRKIDRRALLSMDTQKLNRSESFIQPRNEAERRIARIWCEMLDLREVGVMENFFELGGHSLLATRLIMRLRQEFDLDIPLRALFLDSTIAGLAACLHKDEPSGKWRLKDSTPNWTSLVPMQPSGTRRPFYLVSGAHADEDQFLRYLSNLIPHVGLDQPIYGFKPRGLDGMAEAHCSVESMAADYLRELKQFQPEGPYLIGGECIGGIVAFEMAQQLKHNGDRVALLLMMDTPRPSARRSILSRFRFARRKFIRTIGGVNNLLHQPFKKTLTRVRQKIQHKLRLTLHLTEQDQVKYRIMLTERSYPRILFKYRPKPFPGKITLLVNRLAHSKDPTLGWEDLAESGLEVYPVPGDHVTRLTVYGQAAARQLRACLDQAQAECEKDSHHTATA